MNLASRLNVKSTNIEAKRNEVVNEIVDYFKQIFESGRFESKLEERLSDFHTGKRMAKIDVEFWDYHAGCSDTNFRIGYFEWKNPDSIGSQSRYYRGVTLYDIQRDVGSKLLNLAEYYLKEMGFNIHVEDQESWMKYYHKQITISW